VILFGGFDLAHGVLLDDTWEWNGVGWAQIPVSNAPSPRDAAAMTYDAANRHVVLFGGRRSAGALDDTWEWDGATWRPSTATGSPGARSGHAMTYDLRRRHAVLFGDLDRARAFDDTWEWDGTTWMRTATVPSRESSPAMAYDPTRGVTVMTGSDDELVWSTME
jgi:hypothetical protein